MTSTSTPAEQWSAVAAAWDESTDEAGQHTEEATARLIRAADVRPGDRVLELAAGPGELGRRWSALVGASGRVVISDLAPGMVDVARRRNATVGNVEVAVLDVSSIDRPDASFDVVACRMGLMFAPDPSAALGEIRRVLAPGGHFAALTWGAIERNPWMTCVGMAAMVHGLVAGGPPVGPGGVFSLGDPVQLAGLTEAASFVGVTADEIPVTFEAESIDAHVSRVSSLAGPLADAFAAASQEQLAAVHETAALLAAEYTAPDGTVALPGSANLVAGHV